MTCWNSTVCLGVKLWWGFSRNPPSTSSCADLLTALCLSWPVTPISAQNSCIRQQAASDCNIFNASASAKSLPPSNSFRHAQSVGRKKCHWFNRCVLELQQTCINLWPTQSFASPVSLACIADSLSMDCHVQPLCDCKTRKTTTTETAWGQALWVSSLVNKLVQLARQGEVYRSSVAIGAFPCDKRLSLRGGVIFCVCMPFVCHLYA